MSTSPALKDGASKIKYSKFDKVKFLNKIQTVSKNIKELIIFYFLQVRQFWHICCVAKALMQGTTPVAFDALHQP